MRGEVLVAEIDVRAVAIARVDLVRLEHLVELAGHLKHAYFVVRCTHSPDPPLFYGANRRRRTVLALLNWRGRDNSSFVGDVSGAVLQDFDNLARSLERVQRLYRELVVDP